MTLQRAAGLDVHWLDRDQAREMMPALSDHILGAEFTAGRRPSLAVRAGPWVRQRRPAAWRAHRGRRHGRTPAAQRRPRHRRDRGRRSDRSRRRRARHQRLDAADPARSAGWRDRARRAAKFWSRSRCRRSCPTRSEPISTRNTVARRRAGRSSAAASGVSTKTKGSATTRSGLRRQCSAASPAA